MNLWRVYPHLSHASPGEAGHALHIPRVQGAGRVDNPGLYSVLYLGDSAAGAVAERFGNLGVWADAMFASGGALPGARLALAEYRAPRLRVLDLDDPSELIARELRPSKIVTPDRAVTQSWARAVHAEGRWDGVRWWSHWDPRWSWFGVWRPAKLSVVSVTALSREHAAVQEASARLSRPWGRPRYHK